MLGALAKGGIGDAFSQLGQPADALAFYERAFEHDDNNFTAPKFLYKAGITAMELGDNAKAQQYFQRIKDDYSASEEASNIDIFIGMTQSR